MTRIGTAICAVLALGAGGLWLSQAQYGPAVSLIGAAEAQEGQVDTSSVLEMVQGAEDAPVEVIEYASFTCPHCANFHEGPYKQLKKDFIDTGKVRFVYREVYFDRYGLWASMIARCGGAERFFGITDLIYQGQAEWARAGGPTEIVAELRKIGSLAGLEKEQIDACLKDADKAQTLVSWYQENAEEHGIDSTPSFVINGEKVLNQPYEDLKALIEDELGS